MQAAAKRILPGEASLVLRLHCGRIIAAGMLFRRERLRLLALHMIGARRSDVHRQLSAERTHVGDELPHLILGNFSGERRHAVRPTLHDGVVDLSGLRAVDPISVDERRAYASAPVSVTSRAVVGAEEALPF